MTAGRQRVSGLEIGEAAWTQTLVLMQTLARIVWTPCFHLYGAIQRQIFGFENSQKPKTSCSSAPTSSTVTKLESNNAATAPERLPPNIGMEDDNPSDTESSPETKIQSAKNIRWETQAKVTLDNKVLYVLTARIAALPCLVNHLLNTSFWKRSEYHCLDPKYAKVFQYLTGEGLNPQDELKGVIFLYTFGRKMKWVKISEDTCTWILEHWPGDVDKSVFGSALIQARETNDRNMYCFFKAKLGFPFDILPQAEQPYGN
ncbi:uncharacterized protein BDZ99DRAFT_551848 [Mytilinidion resinicola]|uniref:Uncharacterized protein n=1 Tax=Mytilinidion resinicola TaxID=574789 RepID=A0A6A6Y1I5_9PEZI|nr:uncharacterized protein BDZ99DRAFT_551848 [Mytilinidion resinicola]KAF2802095.1 hypothetical protein BDZ99DRAFT_551848 [Mytilinidion resinicola]